MKNRISISVLTGTFFLLLLALSVSAKPFKANERVAFIGDSITHGGSYHTLIQTFYATRYPELSILCFNVGISGDNAQGGYQRASLEGEGIWESDVRMYRPTTATIMLGMNDVGGDQFNSAQTIEALNAANKKQLVWYQANYAQLLENLVKLGISDPILITPSPYDQTMVNEKARANLYKFGQGKNDLIRIFYKEAIALKANKRDLQVIDFNTPMLAINTQIQTKAPDASIIGTDRVHPGPDGHMVMAYL
ncbi:MAG: SGNH/GDSL hydrolase family protein, partial [Opitutales bacterium]|nr:SGNH/GDSL hydrolase family protein [Opitutales bacterium]